MEGKKEEALTVDRKKIPDKEAELEGIMREGNDTGVGKSQIEVLSRWRRVGR